MRLLWLSDIHLNFLNTDELAGFFNTVNSASPDLIVISGDVGEAPTVGDYLMQLSNEIHTPIFFVLGNHDFYHGSIETVRKIAGTVQGKSKLTYLTNMQELPLTQTTAIVGHDGWADGRLGMYMQSPVLMNDHMLIQEFQPSAVDGDRLSDKSKEHRLAVMQRLADESAAHFRKVLPAALAKFKRVFLVTHVPPFKQACWFKGRIANDDFLPHFANMAAGVVMKEIMEAHPKQHLTVVCGHTHSSGKVDILPNLVVHTGTSEYGSPVIQHIFDIE